MADWGEKPLLTQITASHAQRLVLTYSYAIHLAISYVIGKVFASVCNQGML